MSKSLMVVSVPVMVVLSYIFRLFMLLNFIKLYPVIKNAYVYNYT